jgi:broad specificity phosphatase PhoE
VTLYLVRHGESAWNVAKRVQGQTPHPRLTSLGRLQARHAARLIKPALTTRPAVLTSELLRATQTADVIAAALRVERVVDQRLREQHLGTLQGLVWDDAAKALNDLDWSDPDARVPGGESTREVYGRMADVLAPLVDQPAAETVVVSHGDAIRRALGWLDGHEPADLPWIEVPNGGVFAVSSDRSWRALG